MDELAILNMREHIAIITETKSTYIMIKSTLQLDDRNCTRPFLVSPGTSKVIMWSRKLEWEEANTLVEPPVSLCKLVLQWLHVKYLLNIFTADCSCHSAKMKVVETIRVAYASCYKLLLQSTTTEAKIGKLHTSRPKQLMSRGWLSAVVWGKAHIELCCCIYQLQ